MTDINGETMQSLTMDDLTIAGERLYVAALRYVRAFERDEIDHDHMDQRISIGNAVPYLVEAAAQYSAAYERAESTGCFGE